MVYRASRSVFFVLSFAICAICTTIPPKALLALHLGTLAKRNDDCGFEGNSDLYGLGIRLGVYFQWASAQIIYGWYPEGRNELAESYLVFLFAITIAIIVITAQAEPTYAAEILILTYIIFGGIFTVVSIGIRQRHRSRVEGGEHQVQTLIFTIILASASVYCSWFWLHGLHHNVLQTPCGTFGFLFAKVSLYNKSVYKFFAFLSVYFAFAYTVGLLAIAGVFVFYYLGFTGAGKYMGILLSRRETGPETATHSNTTPPSARQPPKQTHSVVSRLNPSLDDKINKIVRRIIPFISPFSLAYSVIGIEMTIYWNSIHNAYTINTTGQLIPFVIGLAGLAKVIYEPIKIWYNNRKALSTDAVPVAEGDEKDPEKEVKHEPQVAREAVEANHRLGYLDLSKPVEESTLRNVTSSGISRRPISGTSRSSS